MAVTDGMRVLGAPAMEAGVEPAGAFPDQTFAGRDRPVRRARETAVPAIPVLAWVTKGSWAVFDQGLFALSNFVLNIALARWLSPWEYGAFTVTFSVFLFLSAVHFALLIEPMLVFGAGKYAGREREYRQALVLGHWAVAVPAGLCLLVCGLILALFRPDALSTAMIGFAVATPLLLLAWLMRRMCYLRLEPRLAAFGGVLHLTLMMAGLFALYRGGWLSIMSALGLLALASTLTSLWLALRLRTPLIPRRAGGLFHDVLQTHWGYGRWAAATMGLMSAPSESYFLFLPLWHGLGSTGVFRALVNLAMPLRNTHIAVGVLTLPALARVRGTRGFGRLIFAAALVLSIASALYWIPVVVFRHPLLGWLYGGRYSAYAVTLWVLGVYLLVSAVADILSGGLRALERPDLVFRANLAATVVALTLGLWALVRWGVPGAAAGMTASAGARALALWWYSRGGVTIRDGGDEAPAGADGAAAPGASPREGVAC